MLTRYADVVAVVRDARFSARRGDLRAALPAEARERLDGVEKVWLRQLLMLDPPEHTTVRALVSKAFTPRMVASMRPRIEALINDLLSEPRRSGEMDLITAFAYSLPVTVIAEMLGVPYADRDQFARWSQGPELLLSGVPLIGDALVDAIDQVGALMEYMRSAVAQHRLTPADDLL